MDNSIEPLLTMLTGIIPPNVLAELTDKINIDRDELFRNPATLMHELMQYISGLENKVDKGRFMSLMYKSTSEAWTQWAQQEIEASKVENSKLEMLPGGAKMVEYIFTKISVSENREDMIEIVRKYVKEPAIARWASSFDSLQSEKILKMSFEEQFRRTSTVLANLSETYYKDFLSALYTISKECKCDKIPSTLGRLVSHCRDAWQDEDPDLKKILFNELVVLRNSVKHSNTDISIPNREITFIDGNGKQVGPMGLLEYREWYTCYMRKLLDLNVVLRIVFRRYWMLYQMANC